MSVVFSIDGSSSARPAWFERSVDAYSSSKSSAWRGWLLILLCCRRCTMRTRMRWRLAGGATCGLWRSCAGAQNGFEDHPRAAAVIFDGCCALDVNVKTFELL